MVIKRIIKQSLFLSSALTCNLLIVNDGFASEGGSYYSSYETRSVRSISTAEAIRNLEWAIEADFSGRANEQDQLSGFLYIKPTPLEELEDRHFMYNTYPFDLPSDDIETGTLNFTDKVPDLTARGANIRTPLNLNQVLYKALCTDINQIIVTDFPDIKALAALKAPYDETNEYKRKYGFHFFGTLSKEQTTDGKYADEYKGLSQISSVFDAWTGEDNSASCIHLDFAIASPETDALVNMRDGKQRGRVIKSIISILNSPGAANLETLSLRFMHLTSADLEILADALISKPRPTFKRLILSYNDIDDAVMQDGAAISRLVSNIVQLPAFYTLDLKGNKFTSINTWDLDPSYQRRMNGFGRRGPRIQPYMDLSNHGLSHETLQQAAVRDRLGTLGFADVGQPKDFREIDSATLKASYDGESSSPDVSLPHTFLQKWIRKHAGYKNIADILLLLRNGQHQGFTTLDLSNRALALQNVLHILTHAQGRLNSLRSLNFKKSISPEDPHALETHGLVIEYISTFKNLHNVWLGDNHLGNESIKEYGFLAHIQYLPEIRGLSFTNLGFGSAASETTDQSVNDHLGIISTDFTEHTSLKTLDYSGNIMNNSDLSSLLERVKRSKSLAFLSLKANHIKLTGGMDETGYGTTLVNFLKTVNNKRGEPGNTFKGIDLTYNPIEQSDMQSIVTSYKQEIDLAPTKNWPVLIINGKKADQTTTPIQHISTANGLLELARVFDHKNLALNNPLYKPYVNAFEEDTAPMAVILYEKAMFQKIKSKIKEIKDSLTSKWTSSIDVERLPVASNDAKLTAIAFLQRYKVQQTTENTRNRAKLVEYVHDKQAMFVPATGENQKNNRKQLFRSLTQREQEMRIFDALVSSSNKDFVSNDSVLAHVINDLI